MRSQRQLFAIRFSYLMFDIVAIALAFYLASWARPQTLPFQISFRDFFFTPVNPYRGIFLTWLMATLLLNQMYGLYQTRRERLETFEILEVIKSVILSTLLFIVLVYLCRIPDFPRSILFVSAFLMIVFLSLWRIIKKMVVEYLVSNGYNNFNALIIGAGKVGRLLENEIHRRPGMGIRVVGFLDDYQTDQPEGGLKVLGKIDDFPLIAKKEFINEIFVTIHHDPDVFMRILEQAKEARIAVRVVPQGYEWMTGDMLKYNIGIIPILAYSDIEVNYRQRGKRIFDFILACIMFVILLPVFALIMILIKLDSHGPVFYPSRRFGKGGRIFYMLKFRSMVCDAEAQLPQLRKHNEVDGPIFKMKCDPRVTKMGAWLRKYSLDELPQILNVIMGNMSLVGPRPLPIEQVEREDLRQLKRLDIRPGITGLWQIRGRSDVSFDRLLKWDSWYINNWSFMLDLYILFQTIPVVLKAKGAY